MTPELVRAAVALVPDRWLDVPGFADARRRSGTRTSRAAGPAATPGTRGCRRCGRRSRTGRAPDPRGQTGRAGLAAADLEAVPVTRHPFEYAVLRVVPRIERGEAINAGVLLYCRGLDYLGARVHLDEARLRALDPAADADGDRAASLRALATVCGGDPEEARRAGPAGEEDRGRRFRRLTAPRSTVVQPGPVHTGLTADPEAELDRLFAELVLPRRLRPDAGVHDRNSRARTPNSRARTQNSRARERKDSRQAGRVHQSRDFSVRESCVPVRESCAPCARTASGVGPRPRASPASRRNRAAGGSGGGAGERRARGPGTARTARRSPISPSIRASPAPRQ